MDIEKLQDKIYDAYYSEGNTQFRKNVRKRIHWVCSNALGEEILDIGCSQGITSILLGREGKKVFGIDLSETAINDANENLQKEDETTQKLVHFQKENLMLFSFKEKYDCVILGEVLEHINDVQSFFSKAVAQLENNGRLIVTTPFGINDFIDHKRTFYLLDFLKLQTEQLHITEIEFFGKWIGVIFEKGSNITRKELDNDLLYRFEKAIYQIERDYINKQNQYQKENKILKDKLQKAQDINTSIKTNNDFKKKFLNEKVEKVKIQKELLEQYSREQQLLKEQRELSRQYEMLQHRYNNIKNSTLGKLTVKYWNLRNRRSKK
ncbi:methyltransferase domain-containing protein [Pseudogracilibacillus auburnensis]|uniref:2-polyprenyl-6-hydroxyphenyl methylase/3-demethylubiquinone-9 3-methyltransferase n=1 Tax=Pseudogracilibacillus auburnensis TaxID=1494959 RepID=A0A2V3VV75_9BACI|nr:methyltransferase domain-containing protein [Pseudogracilibacillus auburnensis]PXW85862.1 2-polyprenyl-6-hydroxyphenyl methylase/3-demethylubiquinone-9 3-methyltransferase [Pseudogracilibacillus auburnensis]